ncbi:AI-2E family transporter [Lipingzhangella sp. LS1_29]|uniref:AI-2E family transporter n=1 Tax=Lipingzhangella rawalii TaxID=2055835 RepID=A0ABU2HDH0_9ACTN|nr:AI-2E family transporter [Lipingzhangella rawalii]MDS1272614.1 AI-2E family transporter [Lipingzhangella rawalii]
MVQPTTTEDPDEPGTDDGADVLRRVSDTAWRLLLLGVMAAVILWGLAQISFVVIPTLLAIFVTALLMPMANALRRRGMGRGSSTAVTILGSLALFTLVIYFIVDRAIAGVPELVESVIEFVTGVQEALLQLGLDVQVLNAWIQESQVEIQQWLQDNVQQNAQELIGGAWTGAVAVGQVLVGIILILALTGYFVHSGDRLMQWVGTLFPEQTRRVVLHTSDVAYGVMGRYVRGVALVGLFDAVGIGLLLVVLSALGLFDFNLAIPLIVLTFIGAFLPVVGAVITGALAAIVALVTGGWVVGLIVLGWVILIQQLESNVFAPRIYGRALQLPSPVVLLGISVGAIVGNLFGMFLATPVIAVAAALLRDRPSLGAETSDKTVPAESPGAESARTGVQKTRVGGEDPAEPPSGGQDDPSTSAGGSGDRGD